MLEQELPETPQCDILMIFDSRYDNIVVVRYPYYLDMYQFIFYLTLSGSEQIAPSSGLKTPSSSDKKYAFATFIKNLS